MLSWHFPLHLSFSIPRLEFATVWSRKALLGHTPRKDPTVRLNRDRDIGAAALCAAHTVETLLLPKDARVVEEVILYDASPHSLSMLCLP